MTTLTDDQLMTLRVQYVRDLAQKAEGSKQAVYLSRYNSDTGQNYFSDDRYKEIDSLVRALYATSLVAWWENAYDQQTSLGCDDLTAAAAADQVQLDARFRLIRNEAWTLMMNDPKYRATLIVGGDATAMNALFKSWADTMEEDEIYETPAGASVGGVFSIPLARR